MATTHWDTLWLNVHLATMSDGTTSYGEIMHGALAIKDGKIAWLGAQSDLPTDYTTSQTHDGNGAWMTPGLIDCHTHIVYAGNRSHEFEARLNGVAYEDIARAGGGILSTVNATRAASFDELLSQSLPRVQRLLAEGVTTLEIKSGYGLTTESEANMLRVARHIGELFPVSVRTTFLGAHAVPPEYRDRADDYIEHIVSEMLPALAQEGLVDAVDAFCENIGFTSVQTERVFQAAAQHGLPVKLHAEQLSNQNGAQLVAQYHGLSADHLEYLTDAGIAAMCASQTVAVLLPCAYYFLRESQCPPIQKLRDAHVPIAVATDCNPGTAPTTSLLLAMNMACTLFKLTPQEAMLGATLNAACALGMQHEIGSLSVGKNADLALWDIERPADLSYAMGQNPCVAVVKNGKTVTKMQRWA